MNAAMRTWVGAALAAAALGAQAGRTCENKAPSAVTIDRALTLAQHTAARLDDSGAQVVVLARAGQNLGDYGLRYSHLGFAYREGGAWRVVHKLNQCGTARASIYRQGLGEFFLDDLYEYEAAIVIPTPQVQAALIDTLRDNARLATLHTPAYNMVAYPWSQTYQQSNQWALETLAMTQDPIAARSREHRLRRPPEREAIHGPDRNRHRRLGVRMVESQRPGRHSPGDPLECAANGPTTTSFDRHET